MHCLGLKNIAINAMSVLLLASGAVVMPALAQAPAPAPELAMLQALLPAAHRSPANVVRDPYRHPAETLAFFGVRPDSKVVEITPGSAGYYMEILAPWLRHRGLYVAASRDPSEPPQYIADHQKLLARLKAEPQLYDQVRVVPFKSDWHEIAAPGSMDMVLTFRNLHNWIERREIEGVLKVFHRALKRGGVLGVVDHRGRTDLPQEAQMASGYVREDYAIALIERAGFRLAERAEINANPRDSKDYPEGVWSLPPTYRMKDVDRTRFAAIGESDRFTLKFIKP
jgi:predicted methyltransferase